MNRVFVDTSAILALLVLSDAAHENAVEAFRKLEAHRSKLITSSYVLVETYALLTRRIGLEAVRTFRDDFAPLLEAVWVDEVLHEKGLDRLLTSRSTRLSLVDAVSFEIMRAQGIDDAFAYDGDFAKAGFTQVA